jgi:hypothetical protein
VAARRARQWSADDHGVADFWRAVGKAVARRLAQTR